MTADIQSLHRASQLVLNATGERNVHLGTARLSELSFQIAVGRAIAESPVHQAALLTAVNAGHRTFLGGVQVVGAQGLPVRTRLALEDDLGSAVIAVGGELTSTPRPDLPTLVIGADATWPPAVPLALRVQVEEWKAAVGPADEPRLSDLSCVAPAGVFAAALGVSELLAAALRLHPEAGQRTIGMSLWRPDEFERWDLAPAGPSAPAYLPSRPWIIGLGHLGEGYAWSLASLGYLSPAVIEFLLQDDDVVGDENLSTCLLTDARAVGRRKTRVVAEWLEARAFRTRIVERRFRSADRFDADDPQLVLIGVDSSEARAQIASAARDASQMRLFDVGLGPSSLDFDEIVLHTSPFSDVDIQRWRTASSREAARVEALKNSDQFRETQAASGLDDCGIVELAGQAIGVPYVGAAAGAVLVSELLRRLAGQPPTRAMLLRLRDLQLRFAPTVHAGPVGTFAFEPAA